MILTRVVSQLLLPRGLSQKGQLSQLFLPQLVFIEMKIVMKRRLIVRRVIMLQLPQLLLLSLIKVLLLLFLLLLSVLLVLFQLLLSQTLSLLLLFQLLLLLALHILPFCLLHPRKNQVGALTACKLPKFRNQERYLFCASSFLLCGNHLCSMWCSACLDII